MRVLVTGAHGFVGQHLLRELLRTGEREVIAGWLGEGPAAQQAPGGGGESGLRWVHLDVTSIDSVRAVVRESRPDRVFHLAGQSSVSRSFEEPLDTWDVNATGTLRLLEAVREAGLSSTRVLVISSAEVYGAVDREDQPIEESAAIQPVTPYGASKAAAELVALQQSAAREMQVVVARSFNHAGPGQDERFVLPSMARQLFQIRRGEAEPVLRVGNLEVWRDFLDVRDVVNAYLCLMERGENGAVYNVCSGQPRSLLDLVGQLIEFSSTGARLEVDPERFRPVDIPLLVGDSRRLRALGWEPRIPIEQTLQDLLAEAAQRHAEAPAC